MKIEIKSWMTGSVLFEGDFSSVAEAVKAAISSSADLSSADLRSVFKALPDLKNPDALILKSIKKGAKLEMGAWHKCETTHCRAGWYVNLAGAAGSMLEAIYGSAAAGAIIFTKAYPKRKVPNFYASNDEALADITANAALKD